MHHFFLDLWHDLRAKRLVPVAALLLVALAAVPVVLREKGQPVPPAAAPPAATAQTAADKLPTVTLDQVAAPSNLKEFAGTQRNPFKPLKDLPKKDPGENATVTSGKASTGSAAESNSSSGSGSGSGTTTGGTGTGGSAGGYAGPKTTYFTYRADIRFGVPGKEKTTKQLESFALLGDEKEPAAMFMGITDDHQYAVFTVDTARYETNGEHECKPSEDRCELIYLKVDEDSNETTFTSLDGTTTYNLEILAINRVILDKSDVENVPAADKKPAAKSSDKSDALDVLPRSLFDIVAQRR